MRLDFRHISRSATRELGDARPRAFAPGLRIVAPSSRRANIMVVLCVLLLAIARVGPREVVAAPDAVGDNAIALSGFRPPDDDDSLNLSGYVEVPYSAALNPSGGALTIEAWVKRIAVDRHETLVGNGWTASYWLGFSDTGRLRFTPYGSGGLVDSEASVLPGVWTHVAVTYDGVTRRYYINGELDKETSEKPGAIAPAAAGEFLGIGFDRDDTFTPNYFGGGIDNVRIWKTARNAADIADGMFQTFDGSVPNLLAEWSFNGNLLDSAGAHDATARDWVQFVNDGALPRDIRIPQVTETPNLDGQCGPDEYAGATEVTVGGVATRLQHTEDHLWICFEGLTGNDAAAHVYLDADYTRVDSAQHEHVRLTVDKDNATTASRGDGDNTYSATADFDGLWDAQYLNCCGEFPTQRAEFRIDAQMVNGWNHVMGLALGETTGARGALRLWPARASSVLPSTWSSTILAGIGPERTFSGQVVYQPPDKQANPTGVYGVTVRLIGYDPNGGEAIVALGKSSAAGNFSLHTNDDFTHHRLELGAPPKGYMVESAAVDAPGAVVDPRTIDFGDVGGGVFANSRFVLADVRPWVVDNHHGPYFLIVAPEAVIDSKALVDFVDFKMRIGFVVEVKSIESIEASEAGSTRAAKIRAYAQSRHDGIGSRFRYLMLVGSHATIPHGIFYEWFTGYDSDGKVDLTACAASESSSIDVNAKGIKLKRSDWYYADLTSNFDSNGNGCLLDGTRADSEKLAPGYTPDASPTLTAHLAVGRIPFEDPTTIQGVLDNIIRFEMQSEVFKQQTLLAMSQVFIKGQYWTPKDDLDGQYKPCPLNEADKKVTSVNKNCKGSTMDAGHLGEYMRADFLNPFGYNSSVLYEAAKPEGAAPFQSSPPLTGENVQSALGAGPHGFVNFAGHGGPGGVSRTYWTPVNDNGLVDAPTAPFPFESVSEIAGATLVNKNTFSALTPRGGRGAIFMAAACSTLSPTDANNIGVGALSQGHGVAWIGALNMVNASGSWTSPTPSDMATVNYYIIQGLLGDHLRLGDAVWRGLNTVSDMGGHGSAEISIALYGDPTLSYWGNPGGQTTLAAWPMLRFDARGFGYTPLTGPEIPKKLWEYSGTAAANGLRAPVVSNNGEVVVAHGTQVDVLRQGELHQRLELDAPAYGTPAIAADGTIYAADMAGNLYAFPYQSYLLMPYKPLTDLILTPQAQMSGASDASAANVLGTRYRRWKVDLGGATRTSPIVGADGFIGMGLNGKVLLVRPDGRIFKEQSIEGGPMHVLAMDATRGVYVTSNSGRISRINFFCASGTCVQTQTNAGPGYSTPPLLAYGAVYAGRVNGEVVRLVSDPFFFGVNATFQANGQITAGPVAGPGGQILVGTAAGTIYSLNQDLSLRWQFNVGSSVDSIPAFSADALYVVAGGMLRAYAPFSGSLLWSRNLGAGLVDGSAVVGFGRQLFVQTENGRVLGYGEGWTNMVIAVQAETVMVAGARPAIQVNWWQDVPVDGGGQGASVAQDETISGILVQRREDDGPWADLVVLPPDTEAFTDTAVLPNGRYAYRVQVLDKMGNHSEMTTTLLDIQSLPDAAQAPVWVSITPGAADALALVWDSPDGDVVSAYRVERGNDAGGPFEEVAITSGQVQSLVDTGLASATTYHYRVIAVNGAGESAPSAVQAGITHQQTLPAPENVDATLLDDGRIEIRWAAGPTGAQAALGYSQGAMDGFAALNTVDAALSAYGFAPGELDTYVFRIKFVQDNNESTWVETPVLSLDVEDDGTRRLFVPGVMRQ